MTDTPDIWPIARTETQDDEPPETDLVLLMPQTDGGAPTTRRLDHLADDISDLIDVRDIEGSNTIYVNPAGADEDPARPQLWAPTVVGGVWANDGSEEHTTARPIAAAGYRRDRIDRYPHHRPPLLLPLHRVGGHAASR